MRLPVDVWQGCWGHWQSVFIRENILPLGHAAWQGYLTHGRGLVACAVEIATTVDWSGDVVQYSLQYIPIGAFSAYLEPHHLSADFIHRLTNTVQTYAPDRDILIAIGGNGPIEIDWLRNLAIAPPDCHRQVCNRWDEFNLEPESVRSARIASHNPTPPPDREADPAVARVSEIKIRQLQQYLHCPGRIPTAVHPFVKQMTQSQPVPPLSGLPIQSLIRVMLAGFTVMSSLGVRSLVRLLKPMLGRLSRDYQISTMSSLSGREGESLPPPPVIESIILDASLDSSHRSQ